jgi:phosphoenolpyruvate carboxylase
VFAWVQTRIGLPSWYGAGTALAGGALELHRELWSEWPFFRDLVLTLQDSLAACDLSTGHRYLELLDGSERNQAVTLWDVIRAEYDRCLARVRRLTGEERRGPTSPHLDALSRMQVELLRRERAGDPDAREPLLGTIAGIAVGLRTTG